MATADLSARPQEVVLSVSKPMAKVEARDVVSMPTHNHTQHVSLASSQLRDYHKIVSQKESILDQKMNELRKINQEISSLNNLSSI